MILHIRPPEDFCSEEPAGGKNQESIDIPKLLKIDTPTLIHIKHPNHHLNRMRIKTRKIPIHKRLPQFPFRQLSCIALIHGFEEREKRGVGAVLPTASTAIIVIAWSGGSGGARGRGRAPVVGLWGRAEAVVWRGGGGGVGGGVGGWVGGVGVRGGGGDAGGLGRVELLGGWWLLLLLLLGGEGRGGFGLVGRAVGGVVGLGGGMGVGTLDGWWGLRLRVGLFALILGGVELGCCLGMRERRGDYREVGRGGDT